LWVRIGKEDKTTEKRSAQVELDCHYDWKQVARLLLIARAIDDLEEKKLVPERKVLYQFSSRGHELAQILLGLQLTGRRDGVSAYYRSRPLILTLGMPLADLLAAPMMKSGGYSDGRDIGVVSNLPREDGPVVLPMAGDVGSQFTPAVGWAQAIRYRSDELQEPAWRDSVAVVLGGDASVATNGFWSSLTIATTERLPLLFMIEDNGYGISVPSSFQTPGGNIARNLESFQGLRVAEGDGTDPESAASLVHDMLEYARRHGPALLRLRVPRLCGHSGQDTQTYKSPELLETEWATDPLERLRSFLVPIEFSNAEWDALVSDARLEVEAAAEEAAARPEPDTTAVRRFVFSETAPDASPLAALQGGSSTRDLKLTETSDVPQPQGPRINMVAAIRQTLDQELEVSPRVLVFGEDVGPKGGVHAATMGLQDRHGESRVFDTSLSEEGIIGRAVGMALAGLMPVPEIQFRKYADPAMEQLNNCGTIRWRTKNRFAAPIVVRMPGGFFKCGDPWHSVSSEVTFVHAIGWTVAFPSNAEDAVGLLRHALRGEDPTIFFEHRALLDNSWARRPYPGHDFELPFGRLKKIESGTDLTIVTWGAMVERCLVAAHQSGHSVDLLDLRTLSPWDEEGVLASVARTRRCLIVHEDGLTAGFGAEISATLVEHAFFDLDAPIQRIAMPDVPIPHNMTLMKELLPHPNQIASAIEELVKF